MDSDTFIIYFFMFFMILFPRLHSPTFPNNFTLYSDAHFVNGGISLTRELHGSVGRAFHTYPIRFLDPSTNSTPSFSCTFSFTIATTPSSLSGDGLAFLITSNATSGGVQESFLAVEFATSFDPEAELGEVNDNHISLDVRGAVGSLVSVGGEAMGVDLKSGKTITSWVEYDDANKSMRIWVTHSSFKPSDPVISTRIDLSENLSKEFMHVGFSASNGPRGSARHIVQSWEFRTFAAEDTGEDYFDARLMVVGVAAFLLLIVFSVIIWWI